MCNLCVSFKCTCLKALKHKSLASLSPIFVSDVKPFYNHWYCCPGDLTEPCSHFDIPNCYYVEETCSTCFTAPKMKFSLQDFFSKCDQIRSFLRIWSHELHFLGIVLMEKLVCRGFTTPK